MRMDRGVAAGLVVVLLWASAFPAIQVAAHQLGPIGLSCVRLGTATAVLLGVGIARRIRLPRPRDLGWIVAAAFFGMAAYQLLLNTSELAVPAGTASIVVAAAPLVSVATARVLFRERITLATILGSAAALSGVLLVCLVRAGVDLSAAVRISVAAMVVQGIYHPLQRPLLRRYSGLEVATYAMTAGTIMTLPILPFGIGGLVHASAAGWIAAVYLGALPSALGFVLWGVAVGRLPVALSTALLYLVPPFAVLIAWVWLGELPLPGEILGGLLVVFGVAVIAKGGSLLDRMRRARPSTRRAPVAGSSRRRPALRTAAPEAESGRMRG